MNTLIIAVLSFIGFIVAYHTYGKWLARKIFGLDSEATVPSQELRDDVDYVPTKKEIIFGHHFTSIAGTGPIVGPAIAVFWGWLPALLWVVLGSIFIGAVHDFGALVVSLRNRGQSVGEVAGRMIGHRAKFLFLFVLFIGLTHTYGKWLARKIFGLDSEATVPSQELRDDVDYVPTKKEVIFGHHFTSIAGTGPIVGPAIAVFWGWLPALLWVVLGSIFIGAVHDFGALVVSLRNRGQSVGEVAGRMIGHRAKFLFLFVLFIGLTHTYGKWLARKIFGLDSEATVPSQELRDDVDYVPTKKEIIFGHHFTSIAGTGPIVGPAIAVFWGWLPALLWVVLGSIFIGAVHDFGALVVSLRNRGQSVGEVAGRMIGSRAKFLFLFVLFIGLTIVLAIFGLVIALIFSYYPESVLSVWVEIPLAVAIGIWIYRRGGNILIPSIIALGIMYIAMALGAYVLPVDLGQWFGIPLLGQTYLNVVVIWTLVLFVYCFIASVLPVWTLLQPRDFINSHELILALLLLVLGLAVAGLTGRADLTASAPAIASDIPPDAPPIWPFLFITIACGAVSGFHCMVSSGTSSKQVASEGDAQYVGYGAMLLEGGLAVIVILACCAGIGMGIFNRTGTGANYTFQPIVKAESAVPVTNHDAWKARYAIKTETNADGTTKVVSGWTSHGLKAKVSAFVDGGGNFLASLGIPLKMSIAIMAVLVASFAATTLDTATRLQRYVIHELAQTANIKPLTNRYIATAFALVLAAAVALFQGPSGPGSGGLTLWPLFGATNQLLAGLAFMVIVFYLLRRNKPIWFALLPMIVMLIMPAWAMLHQMFNPETGWLFTGNYLLFGFGIVVETLQIWMIVEGIIAWQHARGNYPELPPLETVATRGTI